MAPATETVDAPSQVHPLIAALIQARKDQGLSQADLAKQLGLTQTALSYWENGRRDPSFSRVVEWAVALGIREFGPPPRLAPLASLLGQVRRELAGLISEIDAAGRRQT